MTSRVAAEVRVLVRPKLLSAMDRRPGSGKRGRLLLVGAVLLIAGPLAFWGILRLLRSLRAVPDIGGLLATKMLGLGLLTFFGVLLLSNLISSLSSFFLSRDLPGILSAPVDWLSVYAARLAETTVSSSWMVALMLVPLLAAYQWVYGASLAFYGIAVLVVVPFLAIPAILGSAGTLLLVRVFPARRTRDILGVVSVVAVALLVAGLRVLRPERLVRPEGFRNLVDFLAVLRGPSVTWLPSEWAGRALAGFLEGSFDPFYLLLLWSTAAGLFVLGAALHRRLYPTCFTRAQEGMQKRVRHSAIWRGLERLLGSLELRRRELVLKDARLFFRDATQWSQLIILLVLVVVYVYNIRVLPLRSNAAIGQLLVSVVVFLNVALAGFVLAAIAARFVFPALSLEGPALWLLRSSPLPPATLLWSKFWVGAVPLLVLALALTAGTNLLLGVHPGLFALSLLTIGGLTLSFTAQALAWGITFPQFETENAAQIPTSLGGLLFMLGALGTLAALLFVQFWVMKGYLASGLPGRSARPPAAGELLLASAITVAVCGILVWLPYRVARRRLEALEV